MAIGARDLYFAVRVEDRATAPLRRIANEFRALNNRPAMLQQKLIAAQQLQARTKDTMLARQAALASAQQGTVAIRNEKRIAAEKRATVTNALKQAGIEKQMAQNLAAQTAAASRMSKIRETSGMGPVRAAAARDARLAAAQQYLSARSGTQSLRVQQLLNAESQKGILTAIKRAGVEKAIVSNYESQLANAARLLQMEQEFSATPEFLPAQRALIAKSRAAGTPTRELRNIPGISTVGLQYEKASSQAIKLANEEKVLAARAGIASGAFATQANETARLSAISSEAAAKQDLLGNKFKTASMRFREISSSGKAAAISYIAASQQAVALSKNEELLAKKAGLASGEYANSGNELKRVTAIEADAAANLRVLQSRVTSSTKAWKDATVAEREAALALNSFDWQRVGMAAGLVMRLGKAVTLFGGITVAAMGFAAHAYAKFSTASTLAATQSVTQSNNTTAGVLRNSKIISDAILKMASSGKITSPLTDQQNAIYEIFSGISFKGSQQSQLRQGIGMLKEFNKVATANFGMVDLNQVTSAGIAIVNNFGISLKKLDSVMNVTQAAVRFGKMNMQQYTTSLNQAIPAARAAGYSYTQMASTISFLSKKFPTLRFGTTGYARLLQTLARDTKDFAKAGVRITDPSGKNLLPLDQIIGRIIKKFPQLVKGGVLLQNFFKTISGATSTIQAQRVFAALVQDLPGYEKHIKLVTQDNGELARSWRAMQQSPQVRWTEFTLQLHALTMEIAAGAIPAFAGIGHYVKDLAGWFENLSPHTKRLIGYMIAMVGIVTLLSGIIAIFVGGIGRLIAEFGTFTEWLGKSKIGLTRIAGEAGFATTEMVAMFGAFAIAIVVLNHFHISILKVLTGVGGLRGAIKLLTIAMAAIAVRSVLVFLAGLIPALATATIGFEAMGASATVAMSSIVAASAAEIIAVVALGYALSRVIRMIPGVNKSAKEIGAGIFDATHQQASISNLAKLTDPRTRNAKFGLLAPTGDQSQQMIRTINMQVFGLAQRGLKPVQIKAQIEKLHPNEVKHDLDIWIAHAQNLLNLGILNVPMNLVDPNQQATEHNRFVTAARNFGRDAILKAHAVAFKNLSTTAENKIPQQIAELNKLRAAADRFPPNVSKIQRYMNFQDALQKQLKKFPNLYQAIVQAADATYGKLGSLSDKEFIKEAKNVDRLTKIAAKSHNFADAMAAIRAQNDLSKKATDAQTSAWSLLGNGIDKVTAKIKKQKEELTSALSGIKQMYQDLLSQNQQAFGTLFQGPFLTSAFEQNNLNWGQKLNMPALTKDLKSQKDQFDRWNGYLNTLAKRGLPQSFIKQLKDLGPGNPSDPNSPINNVKLLVNATPAQLKTYAKLWESAQKDINTTTRKQLQAQLKYYATFGKNVALAIVRGLKSEDQALEKALKAMLIQAFPSLAAQNAKTTAAQRQARTASKPTTGGGKGKPGTGGKGNTVNHNTTNHYTYNFKGNPDSSIKTKVKHAHFVTTNQHPRQR